MSKHWQPPTVYAPAPAMQQQPVIVPAYQGNVVQQPWSIPAAQPAYRAPPLVYQPPPVTQTQRQPQVWTRQQPVAPTPQAVVPQYQYAPRPWGGLTESSSNQKSAGSTEAWPQGSTPQGGYIVPWGTPVPGSVYNGPATGYTGQAPGTIYYSYE